MGLSTAAQALGMQKWETPPYSLLPYPQRPATRADNVEQGFNNNLPRGRVNPLLHMWKESFTEDLP